MAMTEGSVKGLKGYQLNRPRARGVKLETLHNPSPGNAELAERARQLAAQAGIDRRAWLCVSVVLQETRSVSAAAKLLPEIPTANVRDRAAELLAELQDGAA
jgi:hypothetical protein